MAQPLAPPSRLAVANIVIATMLGFFGVHVLVRLLFSNASHFTLILTASLGGLAGLLAFLLPSLKRQSVEFAMSQTLLHSTQAERDSQSDKLQETQALLQKAQAEAAQYLKEKTALEEQAKLDKEARDRLETQLQQQQEQTRFLIDNIPIGVQLQDDTGKPLIENTLFQELSLRLNPTTGPNIHWHIDKHEVDKLGDNGKPGLHLKGVYLQDVSNEKKLEHERNQIFHVSRELLCVADLAGYFVKVNPTFVEKLGYSEEELTTTPFLNLIHPEDLPRTKDELDKLAKGEHVVEFENRYRAKDGSWKILVWNCPAPTPQDQALYGAARDITYDRMTEASLKQSIAEKDTLLKEVHHRVKNNLQVIISLINLQSSKINHPLLTESLLEMQDRVRSMSLLHETLYRSNDLARINMHDYIREITSYLLRSYGVASDHFKVVVDVDEIHFSIDNALPCGMIVNELVSNALKYSFNAKQQGTLAIFLNKDEKNCYHLSICDNGVGFPDDFDWRKASSLGLQLVQDWVQQLNGHIALLPEEGVSFMITFCQDE